VPHYLLFDYGVLQCHQIFRQEYNASIIHTYVVYDGSKEKDINVSSLYRYYDHHKEIKTCQHECYAPDAKEQALLEIIHAPNMG